MTVWKNFKIVSIALGSLLWLSPGVLHAAAFDDVKLTSAGELVEMCTLPLNHEHHAVGTAFCYGFFEGAIRYAQAITGAEPERKLVCEPTGTTRRQAVDVFVTYINENPQYQSESTIDGIFRALMTRWPCPE